jgi:hypothetical protein
MRAPLRSRTELGLSARSDEIVRAVANHVASHPDGFLVSKDGSSLPNDQATTHRLIPVIHPTPQVQTATLAMRPDHREEAAALRPPRRV